MAACNTTIEGNFSSNVWYDGYASELHDVVLGAMDGIASYPEPDARSLRQLLADTDGVGLSNIMVTNGAIEAIYLIAQEWRRSRSLVVVPTFSEYEDACRMHGHELSFITENDFDGTIFEEVGLVWICNPNNPTGKVRSRQQMVDMIRRNPEVMFVVDQSYGSFYPHELLLATDVLEFRNLTLICSMTKCYAIPGIRVGYVVSSSETIAKLLQIRIPWSVNSIAVAVAKHFTAKRDDYRLPLATWMEQKERLCGQLGSIATVEVLASATPFFLMRLKVGNASLLKQYLVKEHGLLIRNAANFRGLDASYVRISPQDDATNSKLVNALIQWDPTNKP